MKRAFGKTAVLLLVVAAVGVLAPLAQAPASALTGIAAVNWICGGCVPGGNPVLCSVCEIAIELQILDMIRLAE